MEQRFARQSVALEDLTHTAQRFDLNLPHPLASETYLLSHLFERAAFVPTQAESAHDDLALLFGQVGQPLIDA